MAKFRMIEIDFDVHKCIENERRGFNESANDALRRLLGLGKPSLVPASPSKVAQERGWNDKGIALPHGTLIRMQYNDRTYEGQIVDGNWVIGDKVFDSPSGAASGVAVTKKGKTTRLDGWKYWQVKQPGDDTWTPLDKRSNASTLSAEDLGL
jgi:hypothetical protein